MTRKALGRGLGALIPEQKGAPEEGDMVTNIPVNEILQSRFQPRTVFNQDSLAGLAESIRERGVIQPIIVTKKHNGFELIAGERRWRAVKSLGLDKIPAIVKVVRDSDALEMAIVENIQRENLNPIEEANAYHRLMNEFAFTQEHLAKKLGKSRPTVTNMLRLLKLPDAVKDDLSDGRLTMGHARALLALNTDEERLRLRDEIISAGMNVRQVESQVKSKLKRKPSLRKAPDIHLQQVAHDLERILGTKVEIIAKSKGGAIKISYHDVDELNRVVDQIKAG